MESSFGFGEDMEKAMRAFKRMPPPLVFSNQNKLMRTLDLLYRRQGRRRRGDSGVQDGVNHVVHQTTNHTWTLLGNIRWCVGLVDGYLAG